MHVAMTSTVHPGGPGHLTCWSGGSPMSEVLFAIGSWIGSFRAGNVAMTRLSWRGLVSLPDQEIFQGRRLYGTWAEKHHSSRGLKLWPRKRSGREITAVPRVGKLQCSDTVRTPTKGFRRLHPRLSKSVPNTTSVRSTWGEVDVATLTDCGLFAEWLKNVEDRLSHLPSKAWW